MRAGFATCTLLFAACEAPALAPGSPPDLVLVLAEAPLAPGPGPARWDHAVPPTDDRAAARAGLLLGRWPDAAGPRAAANGLAEVLGFYGYRSAAFVSADAAIPADAQGGYAPWDVAGTGLDARLDAALAWGAGGAEPFFALVVPAAGATVGPDAVRRAVAGRRLDARVVWALVGAPGDSGEASITLGGPPDRVTPPADAAARLVSTFDVMPTLLGLAHATAPSDALGQSLLDPDVAPRAGVVQELRGGDLLLRRPDARLRVPAARAAAWAIAADPEATPPVIVESGDTALAPELEGIAREWARRRHATTAMDRMGSAAFEELQGAGGYWP